MPPINTTKIAPLSLGNGINAHILHTNSVSIAYVYFEPGGLAAEHSHPNEQITTVISGQLELTIGGVTNVLTAGQAMIIPPNIAHSALAASESYVIDVFNPVREDLRALAVKKGSGGADR